MSYTTPHHANEFMKAAALAVVHQMVLACQRRQRQWKADFLRGKKEIDFNARLALFFGVEAYISAQGSDGKDLHIKSPILTVELKYLRPKPTQDHPQNSWDAVIGKDWEWLLRLKNVGDAFKKSAFVVFLPGTHLFPFHFNFQVPKKHFNGQLRERDYAPFLHLVTANPAAPRELNYSPSAAWERDVLLWRQGSKVRIRRQIVGDPEDPVWCLIFSRVGDIGGTPLEHLTEYPFAP